MATLIAVIAAAKLWQLSLWIRSDAISMMAEHQIWTYTGQRLPIVYKLLDGTTVETTLRLNGKSAFPRRGKPVSILYDPDEPTTVARAGAPVALALAVAGMLFFAIYPWFI